MTKSVVFDHRARRVPEMHAVAALVRTKILSSDNLVAADDGVFGAFDIDADQVADEAAVLDACAVAFGGDKHAGVHGLQQQPGTGDRHVRYRNIRRVDGDDGALVVALDHRAVNAPDGQRLVR